MTQKGRRARDREKREQALQQEQELQQLREEELMTTLKNIACDNCGRKPTRWDQVEGQLHSGGNGQGWRVGLLKEHFEQRLGLRVHTVCITCRTAAVTESGWGWDLDNYLEAMPYTVFITTDAAAWYRDGMEKAFTPKGAADLAAYRQRLVRARG